MTRKSRNLVSRGHRRTLLGFLGWFLCAAILALPGTAQEEPVRLKKKTRPTTEPLPAKESSKDKKETKQEKIGPLPPPPPKVTQPEPEPDPDAVDLEEKIRETINRLSKNFKTADDRLAKQDAGDGTQEIQRDIVKDLEALIEQTRQQEQQQQQQQQQSSSSSSRRPRNQQARRNRQQRNQQMAQRQQQQQMQNNQQQQTGNPQQAQQSGRAMEEMSKLAEMYKDIWGHLPETLRQEMNQYSREQFMAKYNELLKQYYATIAEKGRKQGDR